MPAPVPAILYADRSSVEDVLSAVGVTLRLDDDGDGTESTSEAGRVTRAAAYATARVNRYCRPRYDPDQLVLSPGVWEWTSVLAAAWLCRRRGNAVPKSLAKWVEEVEAELEAVAAGELDVDDAEQRVTDAPAVSNVTVDVTYRGKQVRVERPLSDRTPRDVPPAVDYPNEFLAEP